MQNLQNEARVALQNLPCTNDTERAAAANALLLINHGAGILPFSLPLVIERLRAWQQHEISVAESCLTYAQSIAIQADIDSALFRLRTAYFYGTIAAALQNLDNSPA